MIAAAIVIFGIKYLDSLRDTDVESSAVTLVRAAEWDEIISDSFNDSDTKLNIDGKDFDNSARLLYMDQDMNILIKCSKIRDIFSCAVNSYESGKVIIEKGNTKAELEVNSDTAVVDGKTVQLKSSIISIDDTIYIPTSVMADYFSYDYAWDFHQNKLTMSNQKQDEKIYPYKYDYREVLKSTGVKNQADLGTCWAFASLTALETTLLPEYSYDFSEDHMTCHNGYNLDQSQGGEYTMSMAYLAAWKGPVLEAEDPYGDNYSPDGLLPAFHVQEIQIITSKDLDGIKKSVFLYGGVQSSLYMSISDADGNSSMTYNGDTSSYFYIGMEKANHDVVIVGWDDSYSADNFATRPEGDGAFICVNSWGEQFGDNGFFYVSYYDSNIGVHNLVYTGVQSTDNYDNIYQSDVCGWIGQLGYNRETAYFANIYEAVSDEKLEAVGFYATGPNTEYEVYFVNNFEGDSSFADKELVASGSLTYAGYYTVDVKDEVVLIDGQKYAVIVYINTPNSIHPIAIECKSDDSTATVDITDGNGYISLHGTYWEHVEETQNCNICLKMYTDNIEEGTD